MKTIVITKSDILSALSFCAIKQSPYNYPHDLTDVLNDVNNYIDSSNFFKTSEKKQTLSYRQVDIELVKNLIKDCIFKTSASKWNITKVELDNGIEKHDDPKRSVKFAFVDRYGSYQKADNDFIDLDALERNVRYMVLNENADYIEEKNTNEKI